MTSEQKIVQYLNEAHAHEVALVRVLQSQLAMTPRGTYRTALERHLGETRAHARRIEERLRELGDGAGPLQLATGLAQSALGQALALAKTPLDLLRGSGGEEKVLKNAKDAAATETLEIATYTALERLAHTVGDEATARLAASIRADEEKMLATVLREIPKLTDLVARAEGVVAPAGDLPIARYDTLTVDEIVARLARLSGADVARVAVYERAHKDRAGVIGATERDAVSGRSGAGRPA